MAFLFPWHCFSVRGSHALICLREEGTQFLHRVQTDMFASILCMYIFTDEIHQYFLLPLAFITPVPNLLICRKFFIYLIIFRILKIFDIAVEPIIVLISQKNHFNNSLFTFKKRFTLKE